MGRFVIAEHVVYLDRAGWSARTNIPRLGSVVSRTQRTHGIMHHTVVIDDDATPNFWETEGEVKRKMRQLQVIRPDLGLDVPYNFVGFLMRLPHKYLVVCEGRGYDRSGAHTAGGFAANGAHTTHPVAIAQWHNVTGMAFAFEGNMQLAGSIAPWVPRVNTFLGHLKYQSEMSNLGSNHPAGRDVYLHKDFTNTACPGLRTVEQANQFEFAEVDMADVELRADFEKHKYDQVLQDNLVSHLLESAGKIRRGAKLTKANKAVLKALSA